MARRHINQLYCIFDLSICKALALAHPVSTRAVLSFDRFNNKKEIQVLNPEITTDMRKRLVAWLEVHIDENIVEHLRENEVNMDALEPAVNL